MTDWVTFTLEHDYSICMLGWCTGSFAHRKHGSWCLVLFSDIGMLDHCHCQRCCCLHQPVWIQLGSYLDFSVATPLVFQPRKHLGLKVCHNFSKCFQAVELIELRVFFLRTELDLNVWKGKFSSLKNGHSYCFFAFIRGFWALLMT